VLWSVPPESGLDWDRYPAPTIQGRRKCNTKQETKNAAQRTLALRKQPRSGTNTGLCFRNLIRVLNGHQSKNERQGRWKTLAQRDLNNLKAERILPLFSKRKHGIRETGASAFQNVIKLRGFRRERGGGLNGKVGRTKGTFSTERKAERLGLGGRPQETKETAEPTEKQPGWSWPG